MTILRMSDGKLRNLTEQGGYPIFYVVSGVSRYTVLCPTCASELEEDERDEGNEDVDFEPHPNRERDDLHCDCCSHQIPCAYE